MLGCGFGRNYQGEVRMSRRRHTPEQMITALREAEVGLANSKTVGMVSRELGKENARLKRAVANLTVDKLILEEATKGTF